MTPYKILIASFLLEEESAFWNTVRHEYAHAAAALLTGKNQGHGPVWRAICRKIGADPSRLARECPAQQEKKKSRFSMRSFAKPVAPVMKECAAAGL